jgi:hypothetical protein
LPASTTAEATEFDNFERQMNKIEELFVKHAHTGDEFWQIECDVAYNFKYYFNSFNSINLMGTRIMTGRKGVTMKERDTIFLPRASFMY